MKKGLITKAFALGISIAVAASGTSKANPQLTGDFTRSDCRQAFQLAQALSGSKAFAPQAAPSIPADFPSTPSLFPKEPSPNALDSDPAVFQRLDRPDLAFKKLRHAYWQVAPYGKRLVIAQQAREQKADLYRTYLLDATITAEAFLDGYQDAVDRSLFRPISNTETAPQLLTDKTTGRVWNLDRGTHTWSVFSLDEDWTNYRCSVEFGPAGQQTKTSWIAQERPNWFCNAPKSEPRALLCNVGLSEEERREKAWAALRGFKSEPKINCRGMENCQEIATAFLTRKGVEFATPLLRTASLRDPRLLKILPAQMDSELGKHVIEDGCSTRCAHPSRANGAVIVYEIASYKATGLPALRIEFHGLQAEHSADPEPDLLLAQIVDPVTGAVAASRYDTEDTLVDAGFFRYKSGSYRYRIFRWADESYVALASGGPEDVSSEPGVWIELK